MHANNNDFRNGSPTQDRTAAIRQSIHLYCTALGLTPEQTDQAEQMAVDCYENGDSAAWAIAVAKTHAQGLSRAG
jgi:hypothetical protein